MFLPIFFSLSAFAEFDPSRLIEKTYPRDSTVCYVNGKRLQVAIRGQQKTPEPKERKFGEFVFYGKDNKFWPLPINRPESEIYMFFPGKQSLCNETMGFMVDKQAFAVLFLQENAPYKAKLVIQLFDPIKLEPTRPIETEYLTDKVELAQSGISFVTHSERIDMDMGEITIEGNVYTYQDREFSVWMGYGAKGFSVLTDLTFNKFPWKKLFKDETDFRLSSGWNQEENKFKNPTIYVAINHKIKRECLLFTDTRKKLQGPEAWRCHQIK